MIIREIGQNGREPRRSVILEEMRKGEITVKAMVLRQGSLLRLFDDDGGTSIPKYKLIYRNDMKIVADSTELCIDNGIFHLDEKFAEDNSILLERAGAYLNSLLEEEAAGFDYDGADYWAVSDEAELRDGLGLFIVAEDQTIYRLDCCDIPDFMRHCEEYWPVGDIGYLCVEHAHKHGVRLEAFGEVPNGYYLLYGIRFDDWSPQRECFYLYDGYDVDIGDFDVVIPYGRDNSLRLGYISSKRYFSADELPLPLKRYKYILGLAERCSVYSAKQLYCLKDKRVCIHLKTGELIEAVCLISPKKSSGEWNYSVPLRVGHQVVDIGSYEIDYIEYLEGCEWRCIAEDAARRRAAQERRIVCKDMMRFWQKDVKVRCRNGREYTGKYIWYNSYLQSEPYPESIELEIFGYEKETIYVQDIESISLKE